MTELSSIDERGLVARKQRGLMNQPTRILIVEDESLVADDLADRLARLGYSPVGIVDTGEEAVSKAIELRPDLVLMDIRLKGRMDGTEAAAQLRSPHCIPVVFLTSHSDQGTLDRAGMSEPFGYLTKPFQERDLHATIEMALYRHRAEERLRKLERWLATTLRSIGDAVISTDTKGRISYVNPVAELLTGWTIDEALGQPFERVFNVSKTTTGAPVTNLVERALKEGIVVSLDADASLTTKAGRAVPVDDSVAPIRDDAGAVTGCVIVFRDATERREMEVAILNHNKELNRRVLERTAELQASNQNLEKSSQRLQKANQELEAISYSISHDLRAPLRAINGFAAMLEEQHRDGLDDGGRRLLAVIQSNSRKMGEMVDGFLELMRLGRQALKLKVVDMTALAREVVDTLRSAKGIQAQIEIGPLPEAVGDPVLLRQVWVSLLENALKFSANRESPLILIGGRETSSEWIYSVQDNGVGFDSRYTGKLFGVFHRLHREEEFPGHGIGLANVQRIITLHGGRVWAEGEPDKGATFHFSLPASVGAPRP